MINFISPVKLLFLHYIPKFVQNNILLSTCCLWSSVVVQSLLFWHCFQCYIAWFLIYWQYRLQHCCNVVLHQPDQPASGGNIMHWLIETLIMMYIMFLGLMILNSFSGSWNRWIKCIFEQVSSCAWFSARGSCWKVLSLKFLPLSH